jgi:hypothetical protein
VASQTHCVNLLTNRLSMVDGVFCKETGTAGDFAIRPFIYQTVQMRESVAELVEAFNQTGLGLVIRNASEGFAIILEDASEQGRYRYQAFDAFGFDKHVTRDTVAEVILEAVRNGYTDVSENQQILDVLSCGDKWRWVYPTRCGKADD